MPDKHLGLTFGPYLKSKRQEAGLDLEYISAETRIGKNTLKAIENENHARLYEPVYVKGFIRSFARMVGADADKAVQDYLKSRSEYSKYLDTKQSDTDLAKVKANLGARFIFWAIIVFVATAVAVFAVFFYQQHVRSYYETPSKAAEYDDPDPQNEDNNDKAHAEKESKPSNSEPTDSLTENTPDSKELYTGKKQIAPFELSIIAITETWLKAIIDGEKPVEYFLKPGDNITLEANLRYNLLIGNAAGLQMYLNKQAVQIPGKSGQVVNIKLP
jgi:cytoskeletal protein RodZ